MFVYKKKNFLVEVYHRIKHRRGWEQGHTHVLRGMLFQALKVMGIAIHEVGMLALKLPAIEWNTLEYFGRRFLLVLSRCVRLHMYTILLILVLREGEVFQSIKMSQQDVYIELNVDNTHQTTKELSYLLPLILQL